LTIDEPSEHRTDAVVSWIFRHQSQLRRRGDVAQRNHRTVDDGQDPIDDFSANGRTNAEKEARHDPRHGGSVAKSSHEIL
jgi:hypothetical protein